MLSPSPLESRRLLQPIQWPQQSGESGARLTNQEKKMNDGCRRWTAAACESKWRQASLVAGKQASFTVLLSRSRQSPSLAITPSSTASLIRVFHLPREREMAGKSASDHLSGSTPRPCVYSSVSSTPLSLSLHLSLRISFIHLSKEICVSDHQSPSCCRVRCLSYCSRSEISQLIRVICFSHHLRSKSLQGMSA